MKNSISILLIFFSVFSNAQDQHLIDSLTTEIKNRNSDTIKVNLFCDLSWEYKENVPDTAFYYANKAVELSKNIENKKWSGKAFRSKGSCFLEIQDYDSAMFYFNEAILIAKKSNNVKLLNSIRGSVVSTLIETNKLTQAAALNDSVISYYKSIDDKNNVGKLLNNQGIIYIKLNHTQNAINAFIESIKIKEELEDINGSAIGAANLSVFFKMQERYIESEMYGQKATKLGRLSNNKSTLAYALASLSAAQYHNGKLDSSLINSNESLLLFKEIDYVSGIFSCLNQKGLIYRKLKKHQKEKVMFLELLSHPQLSKSVEAKIVAYNNLAGASLSLNEISDGFNYLKLSKIELSKEEGFIEYWRDWYEYSYELNEKAKKYDSAFYHHKKFKELNDSIINEDSENRISELMVQYETEKKEKENLLLKSENELKQAEIDRNETQKQQQFLIFIGTILFILLVTIFIFYRRKLAEREKTQKLEKQRFKAVIEAEEKERVRIAKELHDGLGQLLSTAKLNVAGLEGNVDKEDEILVNNSMKLIDEAVSEVRAISHNMMPVALTNSGLIPALDQLISKMNDSGLLSVDSSFVNMEERLNTSTEIAVYRVIQEILNNMIKHSKADKITVSIEKAGLKLNISISDNGIGFDTNQIKDSKGLGWKNIFSRVSLLNGNVDVNSSPGKGTNLYVSVPV